MNGSSTSPEASVRRLRDLREGPRLLPQVIALGEAAVPALEALVRDPPGSISDPRRVAVRALRAIGTDAAQRALLRALADSISRELDPVEREAEDLVISDAASALGALRAHDAADLLLRALALRPNAGCAEALAALRDARVLPLLVRCLADATARASARDALASFGPTAVPALVRALSPPVSAEAYEGANSVLARTVAAEVLGEIGGRAATEALTKALWDPRHAVRVAAALALASRGQLEATGVPVLAEALAGDRWNVAEQAAAALSAIGDESAFRAVRDAARTGKALATRRLAIRVLARWPGLAAACALATLRDDPERHVREALVEALANRPEAVAREALEALARDPEYEIRRGATSALGQGTSGVLHAVRSFLARRRFRGQQGAGAGKHGGPT